MTAFPTLTPSSRTYTPGEYPHSPFAGMSGKQNRTRHSNVMLSSQLRLGFIGISEAQMLSILSHYQGQLGTFTSFTLPIAVWSGVSSAADYQLINYNWRYIEPPIVEDLMCGRHNVELALETVPPEGIIAAGMARFVLLTIAGGIAAAANGLNLAVSTSLNAGLAGPPGLDETLTISIDVGNAFVSVDVSGLSESISASVSAGIAAAANGLNETVSCNLVSGMATSTANGDPNFSSVSLLLHMDGSNDSTTIADSSSNAHTITVYGNAKLTTSNKQFGTAALTLDGSGDYITAPAGNGFQLGTGDFTVECWCKPTVIGDNDGLFTFGGTGSGLFLALYQNYWMLGTAGSGGTSMGVASSDQNTWRHIAVTRSGTSLRLFIDGVQKGSTLTNSTNLTDNQLKIGYYYNTAYSFNGLVDEFRVTKGVARYTANFTPPSAAFPNS